MEDMIKESLLEALGHLRKDLEMLKSGEWVPDNHSCNASIERLNNICELLDIEYE